MLLLFFYPFPFFPFIQRSSFSFFFTLSGSFIEMTPPFGIAASFCYICWCNSIRRLYTSWLAVSKDWSFVAYTAFVRRVMLGNSTFSSHSLRSIRVTSQKYHHYDRSSFLLPPSPTTCFFFTVQSVDKAVHTVEAINLRCVPQTIEFSKSRRKKNG